MMYICTLGVVHAQYGTPEQCEFILEVEQLRNQQQYEEALGLCESKMAALDQESQAVFYCKVAHEKARVLFARGRLEEAQKLLLPVVDMKGQDNDEHKSAMGDCLYVLGRAYEMQEKPDSALIYFKKCLEVRESRLYPNHEKLGEVNSYLGYIYCFIRSDFFKAEAYYTREGYHLEQYSPHKNKWVSHFLNLSATYSNSDYEKALNGNFKGLSYANGLDDGGEAMRLLFNNIANIYYRKDKFESAIKYYKLALQTMLGQELPVDEDLVLLYENMGMAYVHSNRADSAYVFFKKAFEINKRLYGENSKQIGESMLLLSLAVPNSIEAIKLRTQSLRLNQIYSKEGSESSLRPYYILGNWFMKRGERDSALYYVQKAIGQPTDDFLVLPEVGPLDQVQPSMAFGLKGKTDALLSAGKENNSLEHISSALEHYKLLSRIYDEFLEYRDSENERLNFAKTSKEVYDSAVSACYYYYNVTGKGLDDLWYFMEKSKSAVLMLEAQEAARNLNFETNTDVLQYQRKLKGRIKYLEEKARINQRSDDSIRLTLYDLGKEMDSINGVVYNVGNTPSISKDLLALSLPPDSLIKEEGLGLIESYISGNELYLIRLSKNEVVLHRLSGIEFEQVKQSTDYIQNILREGAGVENRQQQYLTFVQHAHRLYQLMLSPLEIEDLDRLMIVPDGFLSTLPFEVLLQDLPKGQSRVDYRSLDYLIKSYKVSYGYSASWLMLHDHKTSSEKETNGGMLAFAYSDGSSETGRSGLPGSYKEVTALGDIWQYNFSSYVGKQASEQNLKASLSGYDVLHFATHNDVDPQRPLNSGLVFREDDQEDGILHVYEIYQLIHRSKMVVLSACESGLGEYREGEGFLSVGRAFAQMGTPYILSSLWQTSDHHSISLMESFYRAVLDDKAPASALHSSKLDFIKTSDELTAHPSNWASYVLMGNGHGFEIKKNAAQSNYVVWTALGFSLLVIIYLGKRRFFS